MKKGFTLVELLAVIIILGVVGLIVYPLISDIIKGGGEDLYQAQLQEIEESTEKWAYSNLDLLPNDGDSITITILELKKAGFLPLDVRNPQTNELFPNDMQVVIESRDNKYYFIVNEESGTDITSEVNENSPVLVLNGSPIEYVEFGTDYEEKGAQAKNKFGDSISNINITYQYNGTEIALLSTNEFKTYTVIYSASSEINGTVYTSNITRTVVVRDTTEPELVISGVVDVPLSEIDSFNFLTGVTVSDNSGEEINVTYTELKSIAGKHTISYTACDLKQNCITKKRIINVTE